MHTSKYHVDNCFREIVHAVRIYQPSSWVYLLFRQCPSPPPEGLEVSRGLFVCGHSGMARYILHSVLSDLWQHIDSPTHAINNDEGIHYSIRAHRSFFLPQRLSFSRMKNRHGHQVCWVSRAETTISCEEHTQIVGCHP